MAPDPRRVVGALVETKAKFVTADSECKRRFGSLWKTQIVVGTVVSWEATTVPNGKRASIFISANWNLGAGKYNVRNPRQCPRPEGMTSEQHRWRLIDDFVDHFNEHRAQFFSPSTYICSDESLSRWYGQGGDWINMGLPTYVAIDRKPDNGCEIQNSACGVSGIMLRLNLMFGQYKVRLEAHLHQ